MTWSEHDLSVHIWGDFACFTRPEYAAERVSYPTITPSAAAGVLSSIFWKPEFDWLVTRVWVMKEPKWVSMTKNEVSSRASAANDGIDTTDSKVRLQRHNLFLRDVEYVIFGRPILRSHATEPVAKYRDQFRRRVERGSFFSPPYLGLREFSASFKPLSADLQPADITIPIGPMSLDLGYDSDGRTTPEFFKAKVLNGVLDIPSPARMRSFHAG